MDRRVFGGAAKYTRSMSTIHDAIASELPKLSHLECGVCGFKQPVGDVAGNLRTGWPTCCKGYTMTLVTERMLRGEV